MSYTSAELLKNLKGVNSLLDILSYCNGMSFSHSGPDIYRNPCLVLRASPTSHALVLVPTVSLG